jgi:RluA family pseudouridine synthase
VLEAMGADPGALQDGRVFVSGRRVERASTELSEGQCVEVFEPGALRSWDEEPAVLLDREGMIAVRKPAALPTIPDARGREASLVGWLAREIGPARARHLHPCSRLDVGVSGVVVLACTPEARRRLTEARQAGDYLRRYVAVSVRAPQPPDGSVDVPIGRADDPRARRVNGRDAREALTRYRTVAQIAGAAMIAVEPVTGRTHQIRVHLAHLGAPLLGDRRYGGPGSIVLASGAVRELGRIALHAARVCVRLGAGEAAFEASAPMPERLTDIWEALGGESEAWDEAIDGPVRASAGPGPL